jgi:hypothetical protein
MESTPSEREFYYALKNQLDDNVFVFFSISWITYDNRKRQMSETDFLIFDPKYGYLVIEVKGGYQLHIEGNEWHLHDDYGVRKLKKSPFDQAEQNMYYFLKYYQQQYNFPFKGTFGYMVAYPNFVVNNPEMLGNRPKPVTIDYLDMKDLSLKIKEAFNFWRGQKEPYQRVFTEDQKQKFLKLVEKRVAISAAAGSLIQHKDKQLQMINRVQDNYITFLTNYNRVLIKGGAGTGKTWIAIKYSNLQVRNGLTALVTCKSKELSTMIKQHTDENVKVKSFVELTSIDSSQNKKTLDYYDLIVIDEGQDFNYEEMKFICSMLKNNTSKLFVFYDDTQNVLNMNINFEEFIKEPPYVLRENLRNTMNIYQYATSKTNLGTDVITNPIIGPAPEIIHINNYNQLINKLEDLLNEMIIDEYVNSADIAIIIDDELSSHIDLNRIGQYILTEETQTLPGEIKKSTTSRFKGLESSVVIYIRRLTSNPNYDYVAYTRAKYYLYEVIFDGE